MKEILTMKEILAWTPTAVILVVIIRMVITNRFFRQAVIEFVAALAFCAWFIWGTGVLLGWF